MLLEEQQSITAALLIVQRIRWQTRHSSHSFISLMYYCTCISKLAQDIPCTVDCVATNNATHHLEAPIIAISCFTLIGLAFCGSSCKSVFVKVIQVRPDLMLF